MELKISHSCPGTFAPILSFLFVFVLELGASKRLTDGLTRRTDAQKNVMRPIGRPHNSVILSINISQSTTLNYRTVPTMICLVR